MTDRDRLIELFKKIEYTPFPEMTIKSNLGNQFTDYALNHIVDEILANGVMVPPCKVGETVYCLIQGFENPLKAIVNRITVQKDAVIISCSVLGYFGQSYMATDFSKTVFLTKEEAEKELRKRSDNNG